MPLEEYYLGDDSWKDFVSHFKSVWENCSFKNELLAEIGGAEDLAMVIYGTLQGTAIKWIESEVLALEGLSLIQCLNTNNGIKRLCTCLHRFPR